MWTYWRKNHVSVIGAGLFMSPPLKLGSWAPLVTPGTQILLPSLYWCLAVSEITVLLLYDKQNGSLPFCWGSLNIKGGGLSSESCSDL